MTGRKQNKSCDECRRSRIGCDAHTKSGLPCSNCARRGKTCSIDWLSKRQDIRGRQQRQELSTLTQNHSSPAHDQHPTKLASTNKEQALHLHHALWEIFTTLFEPQLGLWIGNDCNPFKHLSTAPKTLVSRLMVTLDAARSSLHPDPSVVEILRLPSEPAQMPDGTDTEETYINQALMSAVHAFSARWLPDSSFDEAPRRNGLSRQRLMQTLWDQAYQDALRILTLASYRSILALYLFAITPSARTGGSEPISQLCYETSLRHYLRLRLTSRISTTLPDNQREEFSHLEDSAYWFGLVCDVSRSLLRCQPLVLISGPSSQARVWALVSNQVDDFAVHHAGVRLSTDILTDTAVLRVLQLGSSCKTMCWAAITDVQDSLFYNRTNLDPHNALKFCFAKLRQFETSFGPRMDHIAQDFVLLDEKSQLGYIWLVIHFQLGILILADSLAAGPVQTTLEEELTIANYRLGSVRSIVNIINLVRQFDNLNPHRPSLLLRDPYPEHASNAMSRAAKSVVGLVRTEAITVAAASVLASSLMQGLRVVSQISLSASQTLRDLPDLFSASGISTAADSIHVIHQAVVESMPLDSAITPEMLDSETLRELGQQAASDPSLVLKTIERHETSGATPDFGLDYLQFIDFTAVAADWDFDDVFAGS